MISIRNQLIELIEKGEIREEHIGEALRTLKIAPDARSWMVFVDRLLLWLGGLALAFAVMFFVAYNWNDIGKFTRFGLVEGAVVLAIFAYCRFDGKRSVAQVALLAATLCLGVLLALYGQTYQTGADPWQLFCNWALLMLPWALIGRFSAIWILWIVLINISIVLYHHSFRGVSWFFSGSDPRLLWQLFFFNTFSLIVWEFTAEIWHWLSERWAVRLLAIGSGVPVTMLVISSIFSRSDNSLIPTLVWGTWLLAMYLVYRRIRSDLFMLAAGCLSGITVIVSFLGHHLFRHESAGGFLVLAIVVIGLGAGASFWLKSVNQECES